jgi:histone deacetylase 1/2
MFPTNSTNHSLNDKTVTKSETAPINKPIPIPPLTLTQINTLINQPTTSSGTNQQNINVPSSPIMTDHNNHPMVTRAKTDNPKPKTFLASIEPTSVKSALADPHWLQAMQAKYKALMDNKTCSLVPLPPHGKTIRCKWIIRVKENADGTINKYKARLVAKGFLQTPGFDFTETFSLVIKPVTIRIILTLVVTYHWSVQQIDINNAFLNVVLQEEVYMTQPTGFESTDKTLVCKLNKALYGLKQAPHA